MHTQSGAVQGQGYGTRVRDDELQDVLVLIAVSELKLCQHLWEIVILCAGISAYFSPL